MSDLHNQLYNGPYQDQMFDDPSALCLALWAKNETALTGGNHAPNRLLMKGVGLSFLLPITPHSHPPPLPPSPSDLLCLPDVNIALRQLIICFFSFLFFFLFFFSFFSTLRAIPFSFFLFFLHFEPFFLSRREQMYML